MLGREILGQPDDRTEALISGESDFAALAGDYPAVLADPGAFDAYEMPRRSRFCGKVVRYSGWSPDYVTRLWRRGSSRAGLGAGCSNSTTRAQWA